MAGRCGIEHDMVVIFRRFGLAQKAGELVERRDFRGAGAGQLLLNAGHHRGRQGATIGCDHALAVLAGRGLGIDVQCPHPGDRFHLPRHGGQFLAQYLAQIRRRVRADQQHTTTTVRQSHRRGAGQRGLSDATLACEKKNARSRLDKRQQIAGTVLHVIVAFAGLRPAIAANSSLPG